MSGSRGSSSSRPPLSTLVDAERSRPVDAERLRNATPPVSSTSAPTARPTGRARAPRPSARGFSTSWTAGGERCVELELPARSPLNRILARAIAFPSRCASDAEWSNAHEIVSSLDDGASPLESELDSATDAPLGRGIVGDRRGDSSGARVARGHAVSMRQLSSRQVHETFVHTPVEVLREMPTVCDDVATTSPADWSNLLDLNETCPDCLAGKHTHFGSHSGLPEVTKPGEIVV